MSGDKTHETTQALGEAYRRSVEATANRKPEPAQRGHRDGARETFAVDGHHFKWWAIGSGPVLVTVSHVTLGRVGRMTTDDAESFAVSLARGLLRGSVRSVDPGDASA